MIEFKVNIKPLSVNEAWKGRRFKTDKYKGFERQMVLTMPVTSKRFKNSLKIEITFGFSNTLSDIDNPLKLTLDCLQKKYGFNDRDVYELNVKKEIVKKGFEFINLKITEL